MLFKDGRITVPMIITGKNTAALAVHTNKIQAKRRLYLLLLCLFLAVFIVFAALLSEAKTGGSERMYFLLILPLIAALTIILDTRPLNLEKAAGIEPYYTCVDFCRGGMFVSTDKDRVFFAYNQVVSCREYSDMLQICLKSPRTFANILIPAEYLSADTADEVTALLKKKCARNYRTDSRLVPAENPTAVDFSECLSSSAPLSELEFTPTAQEVCDYSRFFRSKRTKTQRDAAILIGIVMLASTAFVVPVIMSDPTISTVSSYIVSSIFIGLTVVLTGLLILSVRRQEREYAEARQTDSEYGVRIALHDEFIIASICGNEHLFDYQAFDMCKKDGFCVLSFSEKYRSVCKGRNSSSADAAVYYNDGRLFTAIPERVTAEHPEFMEIIEKIEEENR